MIGAASVYVVEGAAIITGVLLAIRRRTHLPVSLLLGFGLALDAGSEAIGESPEGWRFAMRMGLGSAYPWAVLAVTSLTLRGEGRGRLGSKGGRRWVALVPLGFACYLAALLSSGVRGPALAWCYAGAQAGLAMAMGWLVWEWRRGQGQVRAATATEACAIICAAAEIANVPAYLGLPGWIGARSVYALAYLALVFVQSRALLGGIPACLPSTSST